MLESFPKWYWRYLLFNTNTIASAFIPSITAAPLAVIKQFSYSPNPASLRNVSAKSVFSHLKSSSSRPKCP